MVCCLTLGLILCDLVVIWFLLLSLVWLGLWRFYWGVGLVVCLLVGWVIGVGGGCRLLVCGVAIGGSCGAVVFVCLYLLVLVVWWLVAFRPWA